MASTDTIHFDLDNAQRPAEQVKAPFAFNWNERVITLSDPAELDYETLLKIEQPAQFLRYCASQDDRDFLADPKNKMEGWRIGLLIEKFYEHYGLDKNEAKRREQLGY